MEISSLCIVNENYDDSKISETQNSNPDSVLELSTFISHKETSGKFKEERNLNTNTITKYRNGTAIFICGAVVWTLTIIVVKDAFLCLWKLCKSKHAILYSMNFQKTDHTDQGFHYRQFHHGSKSSVHEI